MHAAEGIGVPTPTMRRECLQGRTCIFVVSFVVLLVIALVAQLLALKWRPWFPGAEGGRSTIESVRSSVYSFMSYIA